MITKRDFQLSIVNGPSKMDLMTSFATACAKEPNKPFRVSFEVKAGEELPQGTHAPAGYTYLAIITGITYEDGSGESFCIAGTVFDNHGGDLRIEINHRFTGWFNAKSRKGYIKLQVSYADEN